MVTSKTHDRPRTPTVLGLTRWPVLDEFTLGMAFLSIRDVALGSKPLATGEVPAADQEALVDLFTQSVFAGQATLAFRQADGPGNVRYACWRYAWVKQALDWLDHGGRQRLGRRHRHWVQGLLFGYSPDAIDEFLARTSAPRSTRRPSCRSRTGGTGVPSRTGSPRRHPW